MQNSSVILAVVLATVSACGDAEPITPGSGNSNGGASNQGGAPASGGTSSAVGSNSAGGSVVTTAGGTKSGSGTGGTKAVSATGTGGAGTSSSSSNPSTAPVSSTGTIPGSGCTPPAAYANLFVSVSGKTQADTDAKIASAWKQLFDPANANTVYYNGPGSDESYVKDIANNDVRTEGMSYGMMIAVQLDHQTEFDRLWTWVKKHMLQSSGQYAWSVSTSGTPNSTGGAPDGDEYFATALIFAAKRWGDAGKFNYTTEAKTVLNLLRTQEFNSSPRLVKFYIGATWTDGSYVLPAFYQTWACFDSANKEYWETAMTDGRAFFQKAADSNGVIADQSTFTGGVQKAAASDAVRCVMNIMMDHNFFNVDPWQTTYATKYGAYEKTNGGGSTARSSCDGLLGFGLPASTGKAYVDKLWSTAIPTGQYRYYDGTLYMLALLHVSGKFQLWY